MIPRIAVFAGFSALLCAILGPVLVRLGIAPSNAGLALFLLSGLAGILGVSAAGIAAVRFKAYPAAMAGSLGLLPLVALIAAAADGLRYPPIRDISTDPANPPAFIHAADLPELAGQDLAFPPENGPIIAASYPGVHTLTLKQEPVAVHQRAKAIAADPFDWNILREAPNFAGFEAVAETRLFRWKDDVVVRITPGPEGGSVVDVRSRSRSGKSDMGGNARRIRRFLEALAD